MAYQIETDLMGTNEFGIPYYKIILWSQHNVSAPSVVDFEVTEDLEGATNRLTAKKLSHMNDELLLLHDKTDMTMDG